MQHVIAVFWVAGFFLIIALDGESARQLLGVVWLILPVVYIWGQRSR